MKVYSQRRLECVPLKWRSGWKMEVEEASSFPGAHGEEIVRCIHIDNKVREDLRILYSPSVYFS